MLYTSFWFFEWEWQKRISQSAHPPPPALEKRIRLFNNLPRPKTCHDDSSNVWIFDVVTLPRLQRRHFEVEEAVVAVQFAFDKSEPSPYFKTAGPQPIVWWGAVQSHGYQAEALVPSLLEAFICEVPSLPRAGGSRSSAVTGATGANPPAIAPWKWLTSNEMLANAVGAVLTKWGVREELCNVGLVDDVQERVFRQTLNEIAVNQLPDWVRRGTRYVRHCDGCGTDLLKRSRFVCETCLDAFYHSEICQKQHQVRHQQDCCPPDPWTHYLRVIPRRRLEPQLQQMLEPQLSDLLKSLELLQRLARKNGGIEGCLYRLIEKGADTNTHMRLLFGSAWKDDLRLRQLYEDIRIEAIMVRMKERKNAPAGAPLPEEIPTSSEDMLRVGMVENFEQGLIDSNIDFEAPLTWPDLLEMLDRERLDKTNTRYLSHLAIAANLTDPHSSFGGSSSTHIRRRWPWGERITGVIQEPHWWRPGSQS
ncbi:hypothetical protein QBC34DRAFT_440756 [Podospora aff. communis PSN243]|uniref:Suppressor of anucleate metulae protein B n=1 Tax=Podospora aff. communis PSN243 TaxID=3040156 RepID=A0AAV9GDE9_9PEZI|nr:hypothetical protein QBC34DRAFT_440756 [Podospora aff. communis PSN243]